VPTIGEGMRGAARAPATLTRLTTASPAGSPGTAGAMTPFGVPWWAWKGPRSDSGARIRLSPAKRGFLAPTLP